MLDKIPLFGRIEKVGDIHHSKFKSWKIIHKTGGSICDIYERRHCLGNRSINSFLVPFTGNL